MTIAKQLRNQYNDEALTLQCDLLFVKLFGNQKDGSTVYEFKDGSTIKLK